MKRKIVGRIIECLGFALVCFCFVGIISASVRASTNIIRNIFLLLGFLGGIFMIPMGKYLRIDDMIPMREYLSIDGDYSYTTHIFLLKSPNKTATKRLKISLSMPEVDERVVDRIIFPLEEAWKLTQNKKSKFHAEYLATYYSLTPYLEEIAETLSAWRKQYLKCSSEEEREQMRNELKQALSKNGPIRSVTQHVIHQMDVIKRKEDQYHEDIRIAENSLANVAQAPRENIFAGIEILASSLNEEDALFRKYDESKKKK